MSQCPSKTGYHSKVQVVPAQPEVFDDNCRYYHPSNARFWFYGDDDPEERLRILDGYLSEFEAREVDSTVGAQPLFSVGPLLFLLLSWSRHCPFFAAKQFL